MHKKLKISVEKGLISPDVAQAYFHLQQNNVIAKPQNYESLLGKRAAPEEIRRVDPSKYMVSTNFLNYQPLSDSKLFDIETSELSAIFNIKRRKFN